MEARFATPSVPSVVPGPLLGPKTAPKIPPYYGDSPPKFTPNMHPPKPQKGAGNNRMGLF